MHILCNPTKTDDDFIAPRRKSGGAPAQQEWRCPRCGKLLGVVANGRLHLRFARGHEYLVGFPATSTCRSCGTLNELDAPRTVPVPHPGRDPQRQ